MENDLISRQKLIDDLEAWRKILDRRVSRFDDMVLRTLPVVFDLVNEQKTVAAEPKWISVKEQAEPDEDGEYICCGYWFGSGRKQVETAEYLGEWKIVNNFILTHWMPLPEPPQDGGAEDG